MRTGKRRSAETIMSRALPGILSSFFVLVNDRTVAYRCPEHKQTAAPNLLALKRQCFGRRQNRIPRVGLSFGTCRNRQGRSASARHRNDLARRYFADRPCDAGPGGDNQIEFLGSRVKMCRYGGV